MDAFNTAHQPVSPSNNHNMSPSTVEECQAEGVNSRAPNVTYTEPQGTSRTIFRGAGSALSVNDPAPTSSPRVEEEAAPAPGSAPASSLVAGEETASNQIPPVADVTEGQPEVSYSFA
ncbi:MAG: hypothetical protein LQ342_003453 [Letrouitia transgressa]|nr:MAG: hypothetical protein LQ342_003453 [Letrouitia transgressa]